MAIISTHILTKNQSLEENRKWKVEIEEQWYKRKMVCRRESADKEKRGGLKETGVNWNRNKGKKDPATKQNQALW